MWREWELYLDSYFSCGCPVVLATFVVKTVTLYWFCIYVKDQLTVFIGVYFWTVMFHLSLCLFFAITTLSWLQWLYSTPWSQRVWALQLCSCLILCWSFWFLFFFPFFLHIFKTVCPHPQNTLLGCWLEIMFIHHLERTDILIAFHLPFMNMENIFWLIVLRWPFSSEFL